jgi:hypothetical protein
VDPVVGRVNVGRLADPVDGVAGSLERGGDRRLDVPRERRAPHVTNDAELLELGAQPARGRTGKGRGG